MKILGLTGGIGSGKTTVANMFRDLGVPVFIADEKAREIMDVDPKVRQEITHLFGTAAYHKGHLDRKLIANQVFANKELLDKLNEIVHPAVGKCFDLWKLEQSAIYVVYEAAILFEKGGYKKCDRNLLITAPQDLRVKRIMKRDKATPEEIEARMKNQWSDSKKSKMADFIIDNHDLVETRREVRKIHQIMLESA